MFLPTICQSYASHWGYDDIHHWLYRAHSPLMERGIHKITEGIYNINRDKTCEGKVQAAMIA